MKLSFIYALNDDSTEGEQVVDYCFLNPSLPINVAQMLAKQRPFHEVTLHCEVDTVTGEVSVIKATL